MSLQSGSAPSGLGAVVLTTTAPGAPRVREQPAPDGHTRPESLPGTSPESSFEMLLGRVSDQSGGTGFLANFLNAREPAAAVRAWLGSTAQLDRDQVVRRLNRDVAAIDDVINRQLNAVLHHPRFQKLEASWRGMLTLVEAADEELGNAKIVVRLLNVTWQELGRDCERAPEFDQSRIFQKIYEDEFGTPGGKPLGLLIGDYEIGLGQSYGSPISDVELLKSLTQVAAAAFCPFVTAASPSLLDLDRFSELERSADLDGTFEQPKYIPWRSFRSHPDSRFVGLVLPHVLMRTPYPDGGGRVDGFRFSEDTGAPDQSKYLWGNAAYAFAVTAIRAFGQTGWLSDICGVRRGEDGGGLVTRFAIDSFVTDRPGVATKALTEVIVTDSQERMLADLGFISLCQCHDSEFAAFYSSRSIQKPALYDRPEANQNAQLSAMLNYILCASQFARYLKVMIRDKVGSSIEAANLESYLNDWLHKYVTSDDDASLETKSRYPLREAKVEVRVDPSRPGNYLAAIHLRPHFQFDQLSATLKFDKVELAPARGT